MATGKHGWDWVKHDVARCGQYAVGYKPPGGAFYVSTCHSKMKNAREAMAKLGRIIVKASGGVGVLTPVQVRDKKTGKIRAELSAKKLRKAARKPKKARRKVPKGLLDRFKW